MGSWSIYTEPYEYGKNQGSTGAISNRSTHPEEAEEAYEKNGDPIKNDLGTEKEE
jgi:hypothetical protein